MIHHSQYAIFNYQFSIIKYNKMTARDFIHSLSSKFNPEAVPGASTVFHFKIKDAKGEVVDYTAKVENGVCTVEDGIHGDAKCVVSTSEETLVDVVTGKANAQMAVFMGKLKITNLGEMMKFAKPFGLM